MSIVIRRKKPTHDLTGKKASLIPLCLSGKIEKRKCRKYIKSMRK